MITGPILYFIFLVEPQGQVFPQQQQQQQQQQHQQTNNNKKLEKVN